MFSYNSFLLATAILCHFFCACRFTSAVQINLNKRGLHRRSIGTQLGSVLEHRPVRVEARSDITPGIVAGNDGHSSGENWILITSSLKKRGDNHQFLGLCICDPSSADQKQSTTGSCTSKFQASAEKTADCKFTAKTILDCFEEGGKQDMSAGDNVWWQMAFCKRCKEAGGTSHPSYACP
ncbi:mig2-1 protein [Mycosarcoma maydis]|uniref:Mig2-1 n=1 Tax=Mycosarcoma maydis TaxID=5270 RepID=Q8X1D7_MYCMD|nr:mig2-1 protein [Ustilago maydis 521]AAL67328.1 Mig2-1 [Ustilago maydis]KIS65798.1 mig2-1 protein [Ustilago maydis 521]|eukprot:XP_011392548.1 mig2-1 protein [Ustilago maydis 521]